MLSQFAGFLLRKNRNAAIVAFFCSIFPVFLSSIAIIILALVTLRKGAKAGFFVLAWGVLPMLAQAIVSQAYVLLITGLLAFFLSWIMAILLRRHLSWSLLLEIAMIFSLFIVSVSFIFKSNIEQWWLAHINDYIRMMVDQGFVQEGDVLSKDKILILARLSTGVEFALLLFFAGLKLGLARWWEGKIFKKVHFRQELLKTRLSPWTLFLPFFLGMGAFFFKDYRIFFFSALIPVAGCYALAGLCFLHACMKHYKYASFILLGFYAVLILLPYALVLPSLLGLLDSGLNLRIRLIKKEV